MTDREMLEMAAKAAGMKIDTHYVDGGTSVWAGEPHNSDWTPNWNPLTDDGDALRLAVKLGIQIDPRSPETRVFGPVGDVVTQYHKPDPYAATRLAIVIAASEIGRNMK